MEEKRAGPKTPSADAYGSAAQRAHGHTSVRDAHKRAPRSVHTSRNNRLTAARRVVLDSSSSAVGGDNAVGIAVGAAAVGTAVVGKGVSVGAQVGVGVRSSDS